MEAVALAPFTLQFTVREVAPTNRVGSCVTVSVPGIIRTDHQGGIAEDGPRIGHI